MGRDVLCGKVKLIREKNTPHGCLETGLLLKTEHPRSRPPPGVWRGCLSLAAELALERNSKKAKFGSCPIVWPELASRARVGDIGWGPW